MKYMTGMLVLFLWTGVHVSAQQAQPDIPLNVLQTELLGEINASKHELTPDQLAGLKLVRSELQDVAVDMMQLRGRLSQLKLESDRLKAAVEDVEQQRMDLIHQQLFDLLTPKQRTTIRRTNRGNIQQASLTKKIAEAQRQSPGYYSVTIDQLMSNEDVLSMLERPAIQDQMQLDDEQFARLEQLAAAAKLEARQLLIELLAATQSDPAAEAVAKMETDDQIPVLLEELNQQVRTVLTSEQYETMQAQSRNASRVVLQNPVEWRRLQMLMIPHGAPQHVGIRSDNGQFSMKLQCINKFADPEIRKMLQITDDQMQTLEQQLADMQPRIELVMNARMKASQEAQQRLSDATNRPFREAILEHNRKYTKLCEPLLTADFRAILQKQAWRAMGIRAILEPEIVESLALTESQQNMIRESLSKKAPEFQPPAGFEFPTGGVFRPKTVEEMQKESAAFFENSRKHGQQMAEYWNEVQKEIWTVLEPSQQERFTSATGYVYDRQPIVSP